MRLHGWQESNSTRFNNLQSRATPEILPAKEWLQVEVVDCIFTATKQHLMT